jgi:predicted RNA-binding Zn ribbon-like protein
MQQPESIKLMGGTLCLDFVNSADWTAAGEPIDDALLEPDALERWGRRVGVPGPAGEDELAAAHELRPALRAVLIAGEDAPPDALELVRRTYAEAAAAARFTTRDGALVLDWPGDDPRRIRFAVVADAVGLMSDSARFARVHVCPGRDCGWMFLDTSGRRRWCSMDTCGSRAKMRALYARRRVRGPSR